MVPSKLRRNKGGPFTRKARCVQPSHLYQTAQIHVNTAESLDPTPEVPRRLKRVLFVDDSPDYLQTLGRVIGDWSHGEWEILLAQGSSDAFALLQEAPADLVVIDVLMPVVDGTQLLRMLHRSHPAMRKVVLTGMVDAALRNDCLKQGADLFLEKPQSAQDLIIVYRALKHVLTLEETSGFRGVLRRANIRDIIQMECLNQRCSRVEIASVEMWGEIFIERGNVVHAQAGDMKGAEAFSHLINLKSGEFCLKPYSEPPERTLSSRFEALLLAAAHAWDQMLAGQDPSPHFESVQQHHHDPHHHHDTTTTWFRRKPGGEPAQPSLSIAVEPTNAAQSSLTDGLSAAAPAASGVGTTATPVADGDPASAVQNASGEPRTPAKGGSGEPASVAQAAGGQPAGADKAPTKSPSTS